MTRKVKLDCAYPLLLDFPIGIIVYLDDLQAASSDLNVALFPISDWPDIAGAGGSDGSTKVSSAPLALTSMEVAPTASFSANSELTPSLQSHSAGGNASHVEVLPLSHLPSSPTTTESAISSSAAMILFGADVKCQTSLAESSTGSNSIHFTQWVIVS